MTDKMQALFQDHLRTLTARADRALEAGGYGGLILGSGSPKMLYLDDWSYPFRANPQFKAWVPGASPDCFVSYRPGSRPRLFFCQPEDYWHLPPTRPSGYWVDGYDIEVMRSSESLRQAVKSHQDWAILAEPEAATAGLGDHDPLAVTAHLDLARAAKTPYEVECMARASTLAAAAHRAAEAAWREGGSEFEAHLAYCRAAGLREQELPYNNIIAYGSHAAVLHYQVLDRGRPGTTPSFLIDAGAEYAGYASDITRTYAAAPGAFADLIAAMDQAQLKLVDQVRPGRDYRDIHLAAHQAIAQILLEFELVKGSAEAVAQSGVTSTFFPHGIGHLLGLQVHDVSGLAADAGGGLRARPEGHPYLRLTRDLQEGFVVTIEPGLYFIDMLLAEAARDQRRQLICWDAIEALKPCGGIRIEDNVVAQAGAPRNLTREALG